MRANAVPPPVMLPAGHEVGAYTIEATLGIGGMAVVYRARHRSLERAVALKVLNPRLAADAQFRARFRREGAMVASLEHPHVVEVLDSGEADGLLFLAMRLVEGRTLADRLADGPMSVDEVLALLSPVAAALDAAHAASVTHRDVKPQNILVGERGDVYLADFGVARAADGPDLTRTGGFLGSLAYVAPEQVRGEPASAPADIYSFAAVLHECLTGSPPFRCSTDAAVLQAHLTSMPAPLGPAGDRLARAASSLVLAGLRKDPGRRPPQASDLTDGLRRAATAAPASRRARRPACERGEPVAPAATGGASIRRRVGVVVGMLAVSAAAAVATIGLASRAAPPVTVSSFSVLPPTGWTQGVAESDGGEDGLVLASGVRWSQDGGSGAVTIAPLARGSALAPRSARAPGATLKVAGGTVQRWDATGAGAARWSAIALSPHGPVAVLCTDSATPTVRDACDGLLGSLRSSTGTLTAEPVPRLAEQLAPELLTLRTLRRDLVLPARDRARRATRAQRLSRAHRAAATTFREVERDRAWDRDLRALRGALTSAADAYAAIARAATERDRSRDRRARAQLRTADRAVTRALTRFQRRGYRVIE